RRDRSSGIRSQCPRESHGILPPQEPGCTAKVARRYSWHLTYLTTRLFPSDIRVVLADVELRIGSSKRKPDIANNPTMSLAGSLRAFSKKAYEQRQHHHAAGVHQERNKRKRSYSRKQEKSNASELPPRIGMHENPTRVRQHSLTP